MEYAGRKSRSLQWLLTAFVLSSTVGALLGGLAFRAAGASVAAPCFLVPTLVGVLLIARAFHEGRRSAGVGERSSAPPHGP